VCNDYSNAFPILSRCYIRDAFSRWCQMVAKVILKVTEVSERSRVVLKSAAIPLLSGTFLCVRKVKLFVMLNYALRHADVWGNGGIAPRILNVGS
jgi:hypothetical protein